MKPLIILLPILALVGCASAPPGSLTPSTTGVHVTNPASGFTTSVREACINGVSYYMIPVAGQSFTIAPKFSPGKSIPEQCK